MRFVVLREADDDLGLPDDLKVSSEIRRIARHKHHLNVRNAMHVVDELNADSTAISGDENRLGDVGAILREPTSNEFVKTDACSGHNTIADQSVKNSLDKGFLVPRQLS